MKFMKNEEEAVSPVIGVILMVAITVILAAVIAAFVFGMGSSVQKTKNVAVTAKQVDQGTCVLTYQGGADHLYVARITATVSNATTPGTTDACTGFPTDAAPEVGGTATCACTPGQDHIVAVGVFTDDSQQVILDTNL